MHVPRSIALLVATGFACGCSETGSGDFANARPEIITQAAPEVCGACALSLVRILSLGTPDGPGAIESETTLAKRDTRGRYYVSAEYGQEIDVFDANGSYLTTIGSEGDGPGEFRMIGSIAFDGADSIHVFDGRSLRHSVYSPSYKYVRSNPLEIRPLNQVLRLADGSSVLATPVRTKDLTGIPLHLLDPQGKHLRSFGSPEGEFDPTVPFGDERGLANEDESTFWVTYRNKYVVELWSAVGEASRPIRVLERRVGWFPEAIGSPADDDPPQPRLQAIRKTGAGQLLVLILVADSNWKRSSGQGDAHRVVTDLQNYYDSIIELVDLESAKVIGSIRSPYVFLDFVDDDLLSTVTLTDEEVPVVEVWRVAAQR